MRIAVIGAGAAGLVAATRLQDQGHEVVVLEADHRIGGRIRTVELAPGWRLDTGAHALGSDCDHLLELCNGLDYKIFSPWPWGRPDLVIGRERLEPLFSDVSPAGGRLPADWRDRLGTWLQGVAPNRYVPLPDDIDAATTLRRVIGYEAMQCLHAQIEHGIGWPFAQLSGAYIRSLMVPTPEVRLGYVEEGLAAPFERLAARLDVRTGIEVTRVTPGLVEPWGPVDGAVLAVPGPIAARLVPIGTPGRPEWLEDVAYSAEVAVTAYRPWDRPCEWLDGVRVAEDEGVSRVALTAEGMWFTPRGWQGAVIGASRSLSAKLVADSVPDEEILRRLWVLGRAFDDRLFPLSEVKAYAVTRHEFAWPRWSSAHATRVSGWQQRPPIVFAGDWTWHPFVEGAVKSGERAAEVFGVAP